LAATVLVAALLVAMLSISNCAPAPAAVSSPLPYGN
jgi:hypothetical protein